MYKYAQKYAYKYKYSRRYAYKCTSMHARMRTVQWKMQIGEYKGTTNAPGGLEPSKVKAGSSMVLESSTLMGPEPTLYQLPSRPRFGLPSVRMQQCSFGAFFEFNRMADR